MELTRRFSADQYARALESWEWIGLEGREPVFTSPFGDVFFRAPDGFWWLDTLEGTLTHRWPTAEALTGELNTPEGQDQYLLAGLAWSADRQGVTVGPHQVFDFKVHPRLGGPISVENVGAIDFVVGVNLAGQLHRQIRNMPPGTRIAGVRFDGDQ